MIPSLPILFVLVKRENNSYNLKGEIQQFACYFLEVN